ncbi:Perilipin-2 [Balamuthia mandrillaris]
MSTATTTTIAATPKGEASSSSQPGSFDSAFVQRVRSYGLVSYACGTAQHYYNSVKQVNPLVKSVLESAETNLSNKVANPLLQWGEPYLRNMDQFGCQQLDTLETKVIKPSEEVLQSSRQKVEANVVIPVKQRLESGRQALHYTTQQVGTAVQTAKNLPVTVSTRVVDLAECTVDYLLPKQKQEQEQQSTEQRPRPASVKENLTRAAELKQVATERFASIKAAKWENLKLRSEAVRQSMSPVNLIRYAREQIDSGVVSPARSLYEKRVKPNPTYQYVEAKTAALVVALSLVVHRVLEEGGKVYQRGASVVPPIVSSWFAFVVGTAFVRPVYAAFERTWDTIVYQWIQKGLFKKGAGQQERSGEENAPAASSSGSSPSVAPSSEDDKKMKKEDVAE